MCEITLKATINHICIKCDDNSSTTNLFNVCSYKFDKIERDRDNKAYYDDDIWSPTLIKDVIIMLEGVEDKTN